MGEGTEPAEITVVVPMYNAADTVGETLQSLADGTHVPRHVIVVDNNSSDGGAQVAAGFEDVFEHFSVVPCPVQGVNAARNAGTAVAPTSHIVLHDSDDRAEPDWFEQLNEALPWDAMVTTVRESRTMPDGSWEVMAEDHLGVLPHDFLPQIIGCAAGFRRSVWDEVGRFDESYQRGCDDTEFFWRVMLEGYEVTEIPKAVVWYRMRPNVRAIWRQRWVHGVMGARLWQEYRERGWDVNFRRYHLRNLASATKSLVLRRIGFWEWYARLAAGSGSLWASTFGPYR